MEETRIRGKGLEELRSSEQAMIRGGISPGFWKKILDAILFILDLASEYGDVFRKGYDKGWDSVSA